MPRKLKTFLTSIGFFDLAVAAPSMKAALEAWGVRRNIFHQGIAQETDDPAIVAATMAQPGVVLRRAVGSKNKFEVDAAPPKSLPSADKTRPPPKAKPKRKPVTNAQSPSHVSDKEDKGKIIQFEVEKARREKAREKERKRQKAAAKREEEQDKIALARAQAELDRARKRHEAQLRRLEKALAVARARVDAEKKRWSAASEKIESKIRDAKD